MEKVMCDICTMEINVDDAIYVKNPLQGQADYVSCKDCLEEKEASDNNYDTRSERCYE